MQERKAIVTNRAGSYSRICPATVERDKGTVTIKVNLSEFPKGEGDDLSIHLIDPKLDREEFRKRQDAHAYVSIVYVWRGRLQSIMGTLCASDFDPSTVCMYDHVGAFLGGINFSEIVSWEECARPR